jgi:hypothetical protein
MGVFQGMILTAAEVQYEIRTRMEFAWTDQTDNLVYDVEATIEKFYINEYCRQRDVYRVNDGRSDRWLGTTYILAADMWQLQKPGIGTRARHCRIIWDKHWDGEKQAKVNIESPTICVHCGLTTSQRHFLEVCTDPRVTTIKRRAIADFDYARKRLQPQTPCGVILKILSEMIRSPGHASLWTGVWTPEVIDSFQDRGGDRASISDKEYLQVVTILRHLSNGLDDILKVQTQASVGNISAVVTNRAPKRQIGSQRTLAECGWGWRDASALDDSPESDFTPLSEDFGIKRTKTRHIREDDTSQFDVG